MAEKTFERCLDLPVSAEALYDWHARPGAFERLTPPWMDVAISRVSGDFTNRRLELRVGVGPFKVPMVAQHVDVVPGAGFSDIQVKGPFGSWRHDHRFEHRDGGSTLVDAIRYRAPLLGLVNPRLDRLFDHRHRRTALDLERHAAFAETPRQAVALSGATGLVGRALTAFLTTGGHTVRRLVRRDPFPGETRWNPLGGDVFPGRVPTMEGMDALVHLAGESIAAGRWTDDRKKRIRESRVDATARLVAGLLRLKQPPKTLIVASAVGFYGARGTEALDEGSASGSGFLAEVCTDWERATQPAVDAGIRVVHLRIGPVLSGRGGMLTRMLTPFRMGVGGRLGSGDQMMSWVALDDLVGLIHHALMTPTMGGPVNATAPGACSNATFSKTLGRVLHRPAVVPGPAWALRLIFGEMADALMLTGADIAPKAALESGFQFGFPDLESALRFELGRSVSGP